MEKTGGRGDEIEKMYEGEREEKKNSIMEERRLGEKSRIEWKA